MTDPKPDPGTPASPEEGPSKAHGDAFLDQSGSRHGTAPPESDAAPAPEEGAPAGEDQPDG
jgi:hypothetical protein